MMAEGKGFSGGGQAFRDDAFDKKPSNPEVLASSSSGKRRRRPRRKKHFGGERPGDGSSDRIGGSSGGRSRDGLVGQKSGDRFNGRSRAERPKIDIKGKVFADDGAPKKQPEKKNSDKGAGSLNKKAEIEKKPKQPEWGSFSEGTKDVEEDEQPGGTNFPEGSPKESTEATKVSVDVGGSSEPTEVSVDKGGSSEPDWAEESGGLTGVSDAAAEPKQAEETSVFPSFDVGSTDLPPTQYENRYHKDDFVSKKEGDEKKSEDSSIKSGHDDGFAANGVMPFTAETVTSFSAPMSSYEPSTLDKKALDEKPLDTVSQTPVMPFSAPKTDLGKNDLVEDKEDDEIPNESMSDVPNDEPEPIHKPIDFGGTFGGESKKVAENDFVPSSPKETSYEAFPKDPFGGSEVKVSEVSHSDESVSHESADEKSGFFQLLEEAGIKKNYIFIFLGVFGGIVLVILFFVFGWYRIFTGSGSTSSSVVNEATTEQTGQTTGTESGAGTSSGTGTGTESNTGVSSGVEGGSSASGTSEIGTDSTGGTSSGTSVPTAILPTQPGVSPKQLFQLSGLVNSYIFGLEFSQRQILPELDLNPVSSEGSLVGVDSSLAAGGSVIITKQSISGYIDLLFRIDNAVRTDVYDYLNHNVDRRLALGKYLDLLESLLSEAQSTKTAVTQEITRISSEYSLIQKEKDLYESTFFGSINTFHGDDAYNNLELFIEAKQSEVKKKADYSALATISNLLDKYILALTPRINDISANSEALIKGVRVFDVPGSNINAIVPQK